jgi:hypothetical protein
MMTVGVTHDLSQIGPKDSVYVLKDGGVVEHGFRSETCRSFLQGRSGRIHENDGVAGIQRSRLSTTYDPDIQIITAPPLTQLFLVIDIVFRHGPRQHQRH